MRMINYRITVPTDSRISSWRIGCCTRHTTGPAADPAPVLPGSQEIGRPAYRLARRQSLWRLRSQRRWYDDNASQMHPILECPTYWSVQLWLQTRRIAPIRRARRALQQMSPGWQLVFKQITTYWREDGFRVAGEQAYYSHHRWLAWWLSGRVLLVHTRFRFAREA